MSCLYFLFSFGSRKSNWEVILRNAFALCLVLAGLMSSTAYGLRPFVSTDADVAKKDLFEIELGALGYAREKDLDEFVAPSLRINYGLFHLWELVTEFDVLVYKDAAKRNRELRDAAIFLKGVLREGALQEKAGQSFAVEIGVLLPSTLEGERGAGVEGLGIMSGQVSRFDYHINLGVELNRENLDPVGLWGVILEIPAGSRVDLVAEFNGEFKTAEAAENSGLIGLTCEVRGWQLDVAVRRGFASQANDWASTAGITFSF